MHRLRDQRTPGVPLHAQEQELGQVSCLETGRLDALRVFHHGHDRHEHHHTHDEGAAKSVRVFTSCHRLVYYTFMHLSQTFILMDRLIILSPSLRKTNTT